MEKRTKTIEFQCTNDELKALVSDLGLTLSALNGRSVVGHFDETGRYIEPAFASDGTEFPEGVNTFEFEDAISVSRAVLERHAKQWRKDSALNRLRSRQLEHCQLSFLNFE